MNPYAASHPRTQHMVGTTIRRVPPRGALQVDQPGASEPPPSASSPKHSRGWDPDRLLQHFMGDPTFAGVEDEQLVSSVPASVLRGLLLEWKVTSPEAARNLENYLQQRRKQHRQKLE
jgi:hypothetical protein